MNCLSFSPCAKIYCYVHDHPGARQSQIAKDLHVRRDNVSKRIISMEYLGFLLFEDDHGLLYPYRPDGLIREEPSEWRSTEWRRKKANERSLDERNLPDLW